MYIKTEKTQKIMAYHVIMHCDMDISEKKNLSAAFLKSSLLSTMTLSQKYSATSWKRSSISLPAPNPLNLSLFDQHSSLQNEKQQKTRRKIMKKIYPILSLQ